MKKILVAALSCAFACTAANALETSVAPKVTSLKNPAPAVGLYVGNSYTYYNCGINSYVRGLTAADGFKMVKDKDGKEKKVDNNPWKARMITISAGRLAWHNVESYLAAHEGDSYAKDAAKAGHPQRLYDVVFLQGQSLAPISKEAPLFRKYLKQHIESVKKTGAEPIVVVTWGRQDHPEEYKKLADAIITEANNNDALALPVGLAFYQALKERPDLVLHHTDKKHPSSAAGSGT